MPTWGGLQQLAWSKRTSTLRGGLVFDYIFGEKQVMNSKQKRTIYACIVVAVLMLMFPPMVTQLGDGASFSEGFGFILVPKESTVVSGMAVVNVWQLMAQWLLVVGIGAAMYFVEGKQKVDQE